MLGEQGHGGGKSPEPDLKPRSLQGARRKRCSALCAPLKTAKPATSDVLPLVRPQLLILPKQPPTEDRVPKMPEMYDRHLFQITTADLLSSGKLLEAPS